VRGTRVTINRLNASNVPADVTIEFRCTGKRCPLKRIKAAKPRNGRVNILTAIRAHRTRFRAGQTLEVRITTPDRIGKVVRFRLKWGRIPSAEALCLRPGASRPARCGP
jgi:hypothetical protein